MVLVDQLIPQAFIRGAPDHVDFQRTKLGDPSVNLRGVVAVAASNSLTGLPMSLVAKGGGRLTSFFSSSLSSSAQQAIPLSCSFGCRQSQCSHSTREMAVRPRYQCRVMVSRTNERFSSLIWQPRIRYRVSAKVLFPPGKAP